MAKGLVLAKRFRLVAKLGEGGMGSVWRADDLTLDSQVAVKLIDPNIASSTEALGRFKREAQAAAALRSVHVVQILDHGFDVENGLPFIAMELLEGESLAARLTRLKRLPAMDTADTLSQVARALTRAHEKGIVHRDLKPDNIFLVREGENEIAKVLDFGIAKRTGVLGNTGGVKTNTGAMLGTPYYMSPEQALGQSTIDHRTDIWSLGIIAYECLTGLRPFDKETLGALLMAICNEPLPVPSTVAPVPAGFDAWFAKVAARKPEERFASAAEATAELRLVCGHLAGRPSNAGLPPESVAVAADRSVSLDQTAAPSSVTMTGAKQTRPAKALLAAVTALLIVGAAVFVWLKVLREPTKAVERATASTAVSLPSTEPLVVASHAALVAAAPAPVAQDVVLTAQSTSSASPSASASRTPQPISDRTAAASPASKREVAPKASSAALVTSAAAPRPASHAGKPEDFGF
jgi:serine/threonine-protein kinase